jgi:hypothetical protein
MCSRKGFSMALVTPTSVLALVKSSAAASTFALGRPSKLDRKAGRSLRGTCMATRPGSRRNIANCGLAPPPPSKKYGSEANKPFIINATARKLGQGEANRSQQNPFCGRLSPLFRHVPRAALLECRKCAPEMRMPTAALKARGLGLISRETCLWESARRRGPG